MSAPRRVLALASRLPFPLDDGWKMRTFHVVRGMGAIAPTTLVTFHPPGERAVLDAARAALGPNVRVVVVPPPRAAFASSAALGVLTSLPLNVWRVESRQLRRVVREVVADGVDCVLDVTTAWERYHDLLPASALRIVDTHNIDSLVMERYTHHDPSPFRRWYAGLTAPKLAALERRAFTEADLVWVCSDVEAERLAERVPAANVRVAPNGVETSRFRPAAERTRVPNRLLFFGRLDYYPNADAIEYLVDEILPLVQREIPAVELHLVGAGDLTGARAAAARNAAVKVIGRVDDVSTALAEAAAVVVPLRSGGGTRLKIVEALSSGCPVVSTPLGAEGIDVVSGRELLLADTPVTFAADVVRLLRDPALAASLGSTGRATMIARYDWESIVAGAARDVEDALARRRSAARGAGATRARSGAAG